MHSPSSAAATAILPILISVAFSPCYSQLEDERYYTCVQNFSCGQTKISYPFWGGNRPQFCGHPSFELKCQNNEYPTIEIDNRAFRVQRINQSSNTMTLASSDLWESYCTQELHNITWDDKLFTFGQTNRVLFLFYNCTSEATTTEIPHTFSCGIGGVESHGIYTNESLFNASKNYLSTSCTKSVEVQVFRETWDKLLEKPWTLQDGLREGFEVEYDADEAACARCEGSGGICGSDSSEFACRCSDRTYPATCHSSTGYGWNVGRKIAIGIGSTGVTMVILLFYIIIKKLKRSEYAFFWKPKTENYRNIEAFLKNCGSLSPKRYTYSDIKKITNSFGTELGKGGFGSVFKGKLENGCLVAVKVLKGLKGNGDDFINEVATISRTSHVHIVTLLGFCFEGSHRVLIYEFMPNGSLDKFINGGGSLTHCTKLDWKALYQIAVGIARGLEYLHRGCNTRILHFDIKPHNILLNEDFCPKISDFGLAKLCPQKESIISLSGARGTIGYIAPEVFSRNFGAVSHKSDVYSYGMMVLEMVGATKNTSVEVDHTSEIYFPHWIYKRLELDEELGLHGIMDDEANASSRKLIIVGLWCIQTDPLHRPSMSRVVEMLEASLKSMQIPPKPFVSSPPRAPVDFSSPLTS